VRVVIEHPRDGDVFREGETIEARAYVTYSSATSAAGYTIKAYVNGAVYEPSLRQPLKDASQERVSFRITEPDYLNALTIRVEERGRPAAPHFASDKVHFRAESLPAGKPQMHILALAAGSYARPDQDLQFTVADARAISQKLADAAGDIYKPRLWEPLLNSDLSREKLDSVTTRLKQEIQSPRDLLVAFIAGHGEIVDSKYYFVPGGIDLADREAIQRLGIGWRQFQGLAELPCRRLFLLETCNSGNLTLSLADAQSILRPLSDQQALVFTASGIDEQAYGFNGHGAFTQALLNGLEGEADGNSDGILAVSELAAYVRSAVPSATRPYGPQHPMTFPRELADFELVPLGRPCTPPATDDLRFHGSRVRHE
jgi:hypothetical protein